MDILEPREKAAVAGKWQDGAVFRSRDKMVEGGRKIAPMFLCFKWCMLLN